MPWASRALERVREALPGALADAHEHLGDTTLVVQPARLLELMAFLRDDAELAFDMLSDVTGVDYLGREPRFEVVYHLYSTRHNHRLRVKAGVSEAECEIDSLVKLWPSANWLEREVFDMYGVRFRDHGDLRRILLYDEFQGHPLRKDYPKEKRQPLIGPRN